MITDGVVVGRVPGIHNGGVHQPDISVWLLPQADDVLLGGPGLHLHHLCEVGTLNIGVPAGNIYQHNMKTELTGLLLQDTWSYQKYWSTLSLSSSQSG